MAKPFRVEESLQQLLGTHPTPEAFYWALTRSPRRSREYVVRLWLTEGIPYAFRKQPGIYEDLRHWLGSRLDVCPKEITLVGSARIGFSLTRSKFGELFSEQSDLDLSIVSGPLLQKLADTFYVWKQDYSHGVVRPRDERERNYWDQNLEFGARNLPLGFFDANKLPTFDRYPIVQEVQQTMWLLTKKLDVTRDVPSVKRASMRVYKTWKALVDRISFNLYVASH